MSTPSSRARWLRGALVGACSTVLTLGAHTTGGGELPRGSALIVAALLCATAGVATAGSPLTGRRTRPVAIVAALVLAQLLGHLTLAVAGGHHHSEGLGLTPAMIAAHLGAAVVLGVTISTAEHAYTVAASVLCWLRLFAAAAIRPVGRARRWTTDVVAAQPVLLRSGLGMRAPPTGLALAA